MVMTRIQNEYQAIQALRDSINVIKSDLNLDYAPPFKENKNIVAEYLNIQIKLGQHPLADGDGFYTEGPPPTILIDARHASPERCNFTFYHEITHHLIRQDENLYSFIHEYSHDKFERTLESYCNIGAAEFLVPFEEVREFVRLEGFTVELIRLLHKQYSASKPAIAIQLAQAASHRCIILVCAFGNIPIYQTGLRTLVDTQSLASLHIRYASSSPTCKYSCSRYVFVPKSHLIYHAYENQRFYRGRDNTLFKSGKNFPVHCEAFFYQNQVFAEFRFTDPVSSSQMSLF